MFQAPAPAENSQEFQQITQIPPSSPTWSTNHTEFVNSLYIMFQVPAPAENSQEFQQIMQIPCNSPM